jgi:hypothetical protein
MGSFTRIVERFFGRIKMKFALLHEKYRGRLEDLPAWARLGVVLTNLNAANHPLTRDDPNGGAGSDSD